MLDLRSNNHFFPFRLAGYRSVSSKVSEEVYVESSRTGGKTSASSSSRSFAMVEETVNGRTVRKEIMTSGTDSLGDNTDR
jgi:hypothetical protein